MTDMRNASIDVQGLSVSYGDGNPPALDHISLSVGAGTVCAVIGPSGCGKSTLLRVIAGLQKPTAGDVLIGGSPVNPKAQKIGFVPQNYGLLPWRTVEENILLGCRIRGEMEQDTMERMFALMELLGIRGLEERYPRELSGGQQQRVSLARSFLLRTDVLLMDEPFSALDAITREDMQEVFLELWQRHGVTTMLVTHYVEEALYLGQKIVLMSANPGRIGKILENPLFGSSEKRQKPEFFAMGREIRNLIKGKGL